MRCLPPVGMLFLIGGYRLRRLVGGEASMNRLWSVGLGGWLMAGGLIGCATGALPPSETTMSILRSYHNQLDSRVEIGRAHV